MDILPPALTIAKAELDKARLILVELQNTYNALSSRVQPEVEPDEEQSELNPQESLALASLGIKVATMEMELTSLERDVVIKEEDAGIPNSKCFEHRLRALVKRYLRAEADLWRHKMKKMRLDPETVQLSDPRSIALSECRLALYKKGDKLDIDKESYLKWRNDVMNYYNGSRGYQDKWIFGNAWCHITGCWHTNDNIVAAHIVAASPDAGSIGEILFGDKTESLQRAGNSLLLSYDIQRWFDKHQLVVVPVDAAQTPITRWRTDVISPDIRNLEYRMDHTAQGFDGKELVFLNEKCPVPRFLYFHFIMSLIRIKHLQRHGWQDIWARYYVQRPFPAPGNSMRQNMLLALATHFEAADVRVVESWIMDHGFDSPLKLTNDEVTEAARRVHEAVEEAISRNKKLSRLGIEIESSDEDSDEGEDSEDDI